MDMIKTGKFLAELRHEANLTQEQLGEELGVTNKTISRWETGTYLPPVEMLQILSVKYGVSINEILSGEKLDAENYKIKAEENIASTLESSAFTVKDKERYFKKKWKKEHFFEMIIEMIALIAFIVVGIIFDNNLTAVGAILGFIWSRTTNDRMNSYVDRHLRDDYNCNTKR